MRVSMAKIERLKELRQAPSLDEILTEIQTTRDALNRLEEKIGVVRGEEKATRDNGKGEGTSE